MNELQLMGLIVLIVNILSMGIYYIISWASENDRLNSKLFSKSVIFVLSSIPLLSMSVYLDNSKQFKILYERNYIDWTVPDGFTIGAFSLLIPIFMIILIIIFTTSNRYTTKSGRADKRYKNNPVTGPITNANFFSFSIALFLLNVLALLMYLPTVLFVL